MNTWIALKFNWILKQGQFKANRLHLWVYKIDFEKGLAFSKNFKHLNGVKNSFSKKWISVVLSSSPSIMICACYLSAFVLGEDGGNSVQIGQIPLFCVWTPVLIWVSRLIPGKFSRTQMSRTMVRGQWLLWLLGC